MYFDTFHHNMFVVIDDFMNTFYKETGECFDLKFEKTADAYILACYDTKGNMLFYVDRTFTVRFLTGEAIKDDLTDSQESKDVRIAILKKIYGICNTRLTGSKTQLISPKLCQLLLKCEYENPNTMTIQDEFKLKKIVPIAQQYTRKSSCIVEATNIMGYAILYSRPNENFFGMHTLENYVDMVTNDTARLLGYKLPDTIRSSAFKYDKYTLKVANGNMQLVNKEDIKNLLPITKLSAVLFNHE